MNKYTVRPYFGHDCSSANGFNNGYFLPDMVVTAPDEETAIDTAMQLFSANDQGDLVPPHADSNGHFGDGTIYWEFGHVWVDDAGNEYTVEHDNTECYYLYQYIDFNNVELTEGGAK